MKEFADVTPTERKREIKARKGEKLEEESKSRRKKPELSEAEVKAQESMAKESVKEEKKPDVEKKEEKKIKKAKPKPKLIEKIKYSAKKDVPELNLRKKAPKFRRQEHTKRRLDLVWRKPTGIDSKKHEGKRGKGNSPSVGYKSPNAIQGLSHLGFRPVMVHNVKELSTINPVVEGAVIASAVGRRKRNEIIAEANKLKITILNPRKGET